MRTGLSVTSAGKLTHIEMMQQQQWPGLTPTRISRQFILAHMPGRVTELIQINVYEKKNKNIH